MPLFTSSSGVQINGGNFYDIAGDTDIQIALPAPDRESLTTLQFGSTKGLGPQLLGPRGNDRPWGAARMLPYDISRRPESLSRCHPPDNGYRSLSASTALLPSLSETSLYPSSQLEPEIHRSSAARDHYRSLPTGNRTLKCGTVRQPISRESSSSFPDFWSPTSSVLIPVPENPAPSQDSFSSHSETSFPSSSTRNSERWRDLRGSHVAGGHPQEEYKTIINDGTFITGNVNHIKHRGETGLHILYRSSAGNASHDAADRYPQPRCHPETRKEMLDTLHDWSCREDSGSLVLWLHGPAGSGKSAIAQSFCQKLETEGRLGGSFFFKRGHPSRGSASKLFPTLAYQLALLLPKLKHLVSQCVEDDPSIIDKTLSTQLQRLIIEPFRNSSLTRTFVIIIDGLDECEGHHVQQEILRSIGSSAHQSPPHLRILIASRSEPHINEVFRVPCLDGFHRHFNIQQSFKDIRIYLLDEFARIHREHHETMAMIAIPWPSPKVIEHLVEKSSGYFIYASTVIKFIDDRNFRPTDRLEIITGIAELDSGTPYGALDQLYTQILNDAPVRPQLARILTVITAKLENVFYTDDIERLIALKPGDVLLALRGLHSIINVEPAEDEGEGQYPKISAHHASFLDFLDDPRRSGVFHVGHSLRAQLAGDILKTFSYTHNDLAANRNVHLAWELGPAGFAYVASAQPSPDLLSLLRAVNPDFLFYAESPLSMGEPAQMILDWLKKFQPLPQDLIQLWEDYCFMLMWFVSGVVSGVALQDFDYGMVLQPYPQLSRYLHAFRIVCTRWPYKSFGFFDIRILLDWSWGDTRAAFSPLRAILGPDKLKIASLLTSVSTAYLPKFREVCSGSIIRDLARNSLRIMKKLFANELPWDHFCGSTYVWSYLLRSCPPSLDLLGELELLSPNNHLLKYTHDGAEHLHNVVQWLKTFPEPLPELTARYEYCMQRKIRRTAEPVCSDNLEWHWRQWWEALTRCDCSRIQSSIVLVAVE